MKQNFDNIINEHIDENFEIEKDNYKIKIEKYIKEGYLFERSFDEIENDIQQKIDQLESNTSYKDLKELFQYIENGYQSDSPNKYGKTANSKKFIKELNSKDMTLESFIEKHKDYLVLDVMRSFHKQNKAVFERYFKIKYDDKLKGEVSYNSLRLCKDDRKYDGITIDEWNRLEEILNPPKKRISNHKLQKYGIDITTRDIAVFMILFKTYYKIDFNSYVEFVGLTRLLFDDLHYNFEAGDSILGTSIERYLNGKELFTSKFIYEHSKERVLGILSKSKLKDFKKYVKNVEIEKFKSLVS